MRSMESTGRAIGTTITGPREAVITSIQISPASRPAIPRVASGQKRAEVTLVQTSTIPCCRTRFRTMIGYRELNMPVAFLAAPAVGLHLLPVSWFDLSSQDHEPTRQSARSKLENRSGNRDRV
jgi:hypothetical protein